MADWESALNADSVNWLLEKDGPSVQYFTLTAILEWPESAHEVSKAKKQITNLTRRTWFDEALSKRVLSPRKPLKG